MSDFIWILPRDKSVSLGEVGVASTYILPRALVSLNVSELVNCYIWVVIREENDRLALVLKTHRVEKILDGYYKDDFLLTPDLYSSMRVGAQFIDLASFSTEFTISAKEGISKISQEDVETLSVLLQRNLSIRLIQPSKKNLTKFTLENPSENPVTLARMVILAAVTYFNLIDIWSDGRRKNFRNSPYASIALAFIENQFPNVKLEKISDILVDLDPLTRILSRKLNFQFSQSGDLVNIAAPKFDGQFTRIDPSEIFAREFSPTFQTSFNSIESIKKTEAAEAKHQEILKDVSHYLIERGIEIFQSNSIDLAYQLGAVLYVFEIKTANLENAISQASKGAFQLAHYKNSLTSDYENVVISLLLEDTGFTEFNNFLAEALKTLGVVTYFYCSSKAWPLRVAGLPVISD